MPATPSDITVLLERSRGGDAAAREQDFALSYEELRRVASNLTRAERLGQSGRRWRGRITRGQGLPLRRGWPEDGVIPLWTDTRSLTLASRIAPGAPHCSRGRDEVLRRYFGACNACSRVGVSVDPGSSSFGCHWLYTVSRHRAGTVTSHLQSKGPRATRRTRPSWITSDPSPRTPTRKGLLNLADASGLPSGDSPIRCSLMT
ncbi:MAG: hypothetical protein IPF82_16115 [Blastocatellia bacterium]|nr:hypothetical protein [Blastocatellia bacterium]